jgi:hypothetical protein
MKCPQCNQENQPEARFCRHCGQALPVAPAAARPSPAAASPPPLQAPGSASGIICPACGATAKPGARFCPRCGNVVGRASAASTPIQHGTPQGGDPVAPPPHGQGAQPRPQSQAPSASPSQITQPMAASQSSPAGPSAHHQQPPPQQPAYTAPQTPVPAAPTPQAQTISKRRPWWMWGLLGLAILCIVFIVVVLIPMILFPRIFSRTGGSVAPEATLAAAPLASTSTPGPIAETPTVTPAATETPVPTSTNTPEPEPFNVGIELSSSPEFPTVGVPFVLTATVSNDGSLSVDIRRYELLGQWLPGMELSLPEAPLVEEVLEGWRIAPGQLRELVFEFTPVQTGAVRLRVDVRMDVLADPLFTEVLSSDLLEATISPP